LLKLDIEDFRPLPASNSFIKIGVVKPHFNHKLKLFCPFFLIVVFPCMLIIAQLLFQQNALVGGALGGARTTQQPLRTPTSRNNPRDMQQHF
jgi:hypothetical protein